MSSAEKGIKIENHTHEIKYCTYLEKSSSAYSGGFVCNLCRKSYGQKINCFHCSPCQYDICDKCFTAEVEKDAKKLNLY